MWDLSAPGRQLYRRRERERERERRSTREWRGVTKRSFVYGHLSWPHARLSKRAFPVLIHSPRRHCVTNISVNTRNQIRPWLHARVVLHPRAATLPWDPLWSYQLLYASPMQCCRKAKENETLPNIYIAITVIMYKAPSCPGTPDPQGRPSNTSSHLVLLINGKLAKESATLKANCKES